LIRATGKRPSIIRTIRDRIRYLFIDQIVCESFHIYSTLKSSKYRLIDKIVFVPNCPLPIYQNRTKLRDRPKNFLFVGRISDNEKGADILLENWLKVFRDLKGWRLLLAGPSDESFRTLWETKFEQNDAASSVKWENYVSPYELVEYYSNSRIVICTSRKESGPIILTESAMMGCAFIGSAVGEIPSILSDLPGLFRSDIELQMEIIKFANDSEIAQNQSDILYERVKDRVWSEQVKKIQNPWG
jgi:glycosyltransferase involved in cell wall biosynthesis